MSSRHVLSVTSKGKRTMANNYFFTSESVSEGHPDKVSDQISDAILDAILAQDPTARVAAETLCNTGLVVLAGEITTTANVDYIHVARDTIRQIGYDNTEYGIDYKGCAVLVAYDKQSPDIAQGVDKAHDDGLDQGAGDQGMMFGYATNETENLMPLALDLAHKILIELAAIRREKNSKMPYLRPDAKSQVTIEYDDNDKPLRIDAVVVSTQHDDFSKNDKQMLDRIKKDVISIVMPRVKATCKKDVQKLFNDRQMYKKKMIEAQQKYEDTKDYAYEKLAVQYHPDKNPNNKDQFISQGLWSYSRHPNYFGEITLWLGIAIMSFSSLSNGQYITLISPLFTYFLLVYISGVRILENTGMEKWGHLETYQTYISTTPSLVPNFRLFKKKKV
mgnify:CR=1 FL=1